MDRLKATWFYFTFNATEASCLQRVFRSSFASEGLKSGAQSLALSAHLAIAEILPGQSF